MKRLILFCCFLLCLTTLLVSCSNDNSKELTSQIDELKKQVDNLTSENQTLKDQLAQATAAAAQNEAQAAEDASPSQQSEPTPESTPVIELNKTLVVKDFAEITLTKAKFTSKVVPPKPDSYYSYYEVKDPANIYLETVIKVKSLLTSEKGAEEFAAVSVKYDDKYDYDSFSTIEESGGSNFTYTNITSIEPLKNGILHFIAELPKEASKDQKSIKITVTIQGENYIYTMR